MYPFSYTSVKVIHEQKVQEALEDRRFYTERKARRRGLFQMLRRFPTLFGSRSPQKQSDSLPACTESMECVVS